MSLFRSHTKPKITPLYSARESIHNLKASINPSSYFSAQRPASSRISQIHSLKNLLQQSKGKSSRGRLRRIDKLELIRSQIKATRKRFNFDQGIDFSSFTKNLKDLFCKNLVINPHEIQINNKYPKTEEQQIQWVEKGLVVQTLEVPKQIKRTQSRRVNLTAESRRSNRDPISFEKYSKANNLYSLTKPDLIRHKKKSLKLQGWAKDSQANYCTDVYNFQ